VGEVNRFVLRFPQTPADIRAACEDGCELFRTVFSRSESWYKKVIFKGSCTRYYGRFYLFESNIIPWVNVHYYVFTETGKYYVPQPLWVFRQV
jgi:hypothetical protein